MEVINFQKRSLTLILIVFSYHFIQVSSFSAGIQNVLNAIGDGVEKIAGTLENFVEKVELVGKVITDAIEEECEFHCKNGVKPLPNVSYIASSNGCGSLGLQLDSTVLPLEKLTRCCNKHDVCYDTCNEAKEDCDKTFKKCLYGICRNSNSVVNDVVLTKCKAAAKFMYAGTMAFGCKSYKDAQSHACICKPNNYDDL